MFTDFPLFHFDMSKVVPTDQIYFLLFWYAVCFMLKRAINPEASDFHWHDRVPYPPAPEIGPPRNSLDAFLRGDPETYRQRQAAVQWRLNAQALICLPYNLSVLTLQFWQDLWRSSQQPPTPEPPISIEIQQPQVNPTSLPMTDRTSILISHSFPTGYKP